MFFLLQCKIQLIISGVYFLFSPLNQQETQKKEEEEEEDRKSKEWMPFFVIHLILHINNKRI